MSSVWRSVFGVWCVVCVGCCLLLVVSGFSSQVPYLLFILLSLLYPPCFLFIVCCLLFVVCCLLCGA